MNLHGPRSLTSRVVHLQSREKHRSPTTGGSAPAISMPPEFACIKGAISWNPLQMQPCPLQLSAASWKTASFPVKARWAKESFERQKMIRTIERSSGLLMMSLIPHYGNVQARFYIRPFTKVPYL